MQVIINADDFGLTEGVCGGIVQAIHSGCLTATTAMACAPRAREHLGRWAGKIPGSIGAHLQLTSGTPVSPALEIPSLVDASGRFASSRKQIHAPEPAEIIAEWEAQIQVLVGLGICPTHIDTHHHVHRLPGVRDAYCEIARRYGVPARSTDPEMTARLRGMGVSCVDKTVMTWFGGELSVASLLSVIAEGGRGCENGCIEVMCHPGLVDDGLAPLSRYVEEREKELGVLCDPALRESLFAAGFSLCSFGVLGRK